MRRRAKARRTSWQKSKLGLPDLEQVKSAVLVIFGHRNRSAGYRRSIDDFVCWYCSEPRLSFNKTVVTRYRIHLEERLLAPGTINVRLAAVRRLAYEAADTGLLSPDLAAGIRRVKGARKLGMRLGNWLTVEEARSLWQLPNMHTVKGRDRAILARASRLWPLGQKQVAHCSAAIRWRRRASRKKQSSIPSPARWNSP